VIERFHEPERHIALKNIATKRILGTSDVACATPIGNEGKSKSAHRFAPEGTDRLCTLKAADSPFPVSEILRFRHHQMCP